VEQLPLISDVVIETYHHRGHPLRQMTYRRKLAQRKQRCKRYYRLSH
jgi:hypothetical protein